MAPSSENEDLLRSIIGPPKMYRLGVPIRPLPDAQEAGSADFTPMPLVTLRHRAAAWAEAVRGSRQLQAMVAGAAVLVVVAAVLLWPRPSQAPSATSQAPAAAGSVAPELPLAPAGQASGATPPLAIAVAPGAFKGTEAAPAASGPLPPAAVPLPPPAKLAPAAPPVPAPQSAPAKPVPGEKPPGAVVLDASSRAAPSTPAAAAPPASGRPAAPSVPSVGAGAGGKLVGPAREMPATAPAPTAGAQPAPAAGAGDDKPRVTVVDIDKSGSFALITNPQTRLPEKVTVGQKIFTGETIRKIDAAAGKIVLDSRTVSMQ